jgi:hypothetical protein
MDPHLRMNLGTEARAHIERQWSSQRMVECTAAVYDEVLAAHKGVGRRDVSGPSGEANRRPT